MSDLDRPLSPVLTHGGMLLLGMVLTVGAYEGTRLIRNTTAALSAASFADAPAGAVEEAPVEARTEVEPVAAEEPAPRTTERRGRKGRKARRAAREAKGLEPRGPRTRPRMERVEDVKSLPGVMLSPKRLSSDGLPAGARLAIRPDALLREKHLDEEEVEVEVLDTGLPVHE